MFKGKLQIARKISWKFPTPCLEQRCSVQEDLFHLQFSFAERPQKKLFRKPVARHKNLGSLWRLKLQKGWRLVQF